MESQSVELSALCIECASNCKEFVFLESKKKDSEVNLWVLVSIMEGSMAEGRADACLKELYVSAVGWLTRGNVWVIRKLASWSFQEFTVL